MENMNLGLWVTLYILGRSEGNHLSWMGDQAIVELVHDRTSQKNSELKALQLYSSQENSHCC